MSYREKKVMTISVVSELTGLTERQIRYYEERKLIVPDRTKGGTRKYSFDDIEKLVNISKKLEEGVSTFEMRKEERAQTGQELRKIIQGQINSKFGVKNR